MHYTKADELQQSKHFLYETVFLDTYKVILLLHSGTYEKRWGVCTVAQQPAETHSLFKKTFLVLVDKCASVGTSHRKESQTRFTKTLVMHWLIVMGWKMETCLCLLSILYSVHPLSMWVWVKLSIGIIHKLQQSMIKILNLEKCTTADIHSTHGSCSRWSLKYVSLLSLSLSLLLKLWNKTVTMWPLHVLVDTQYQHADSGPLLVLVPSKNECTWTGDVCLTYIPNWFTFGPSGSFSKTYRPQLILTSLEGSWTRGSFRRVKQGHGKSTEMEPSVNWALRSVDRMCPRLLGFSAQPLIQGRSKNMLQGLYRL